MQKLAVALTTQEEFNEYMEYADNKRSRSFSKDARILNGRNTCVAIENEFILENKHYFLSNWYKIISLKEAIGEKEERASFKDWYDVAREEREKKFWENKEIIREVEARGFEHKTLWWIAKAHMPDIGHTDIRACFFITWDDAPKWAFDIKTLLSLWFEPIEEPKRDWIDEVINHLVSIHWRLIESNNNEIREAIEKHMPRISKDEVWEIERWDSRVGTKYVHVPQLLDLLRSKWLLE